MAGIIGQITAQARVRRLKKRISADKCNYILPPFSSTGFQPSLHNNYVRNQIRNTKIREEEEEDKILQKELDDYEKVGYRNI